MNRPRTFIDLSRPSEVALICISEKPMAITPKPAASAAVPASQPAAVSAKKDGPADLFAWGLLALLGGGMAVLGFHEIPKEQLTPFVAVLSGIIGAGVGTFIGWKWGNAQAAKKTAQG